MYNVSAIKALFQMGYRNKLIQIITGYKQSYISKMVNSPRPYIPSLDNITEEQATRKFVIDRILEMRQLPTIGFGEQDRSYIKLLDYCLVDKEKIRKLYYNISTYKVSQTLKSKNIKKEDFNPNLIGITDEQFACFLETANF